MFDDGNNTGCAIVLVILAIVVSGIIKGCIDMQDRETARQQQEIAERQRREAEQAERARQAAFMAELNAFAQDKAPDLWKALKEAQFLQSDLAKKLAQLRETFIRLNRDPDKDKDFIRHLNAHSDMLDTERQLQEQVANLYLSYKKFELSPHDKIMQAELEEKMALGIQAAKNAEERYETLRNNLAK